MQPQVLQPKNSLNFHEEKKFAVEEFSESSDKDARPSSVPSQQDYVAAIATGVEDFNAAAEETLDK